MAFTFQLFYKMAADEPTGAVYEYSFHDVFLDFEAMLELICEK